MRPADQVDALLKARAEIDEQLRQHKNALTVLFTDVVGSTRFFERNGDTAGLVMIHRHDEMSKQAIEQHGGTVIKMIGDSAMAEFQDPASAVRSAVEIQRRFLKLNSALAEDQRIQVRIGIHTGVGFRKGNDVFGDVVNVTSRIVKRTAAAQILISRPMYEAVSTEEDLHCRWLNKVTIDGRTEKEDIFEVVWTDADAYREMQEKLSASSQIPARYQVLSQIGIGGTGIVYKARDLETDEIVALKVLKPEIASDPEVQENFKRELCLARKITHKNVCRIHEFNRSNGTACTSMEFVEGESLAAKLARAGALPLNEMVDIARQICAGLREAHAQGIVHRDLKPANIMLDRSGTVKIMDFGIARMVQRDGPMTGTIVGTPEYMAPEQAELKPLGSCTDIYALGLLLYEMITGVVAFGGDTPVAIALKQIREYPKRPRDIVPQLTGSVDAVIMKCLQKDPAKRFQSVDALEAALVKAARARRASPWEVALNRWVDRAEIEGRKLLHQGAERAEALLKNQDWSALQRIQKEPIAMLGVAGIAGALTIFVWVGAWRPRTANAQTLQAAGQDSASPVGAARDHSSLDPQTSSVPESLGPMESREVSLFETAKIGDAKTQPPNLRSQNAPALENVSVASESAVSEASSARPTQTLKRAKSAVHPDARNPQPDGRTQNQTQALASPAQAQALMSAIAPAPASTESAKMPSQEVTATEPSADPASPAGQPKAEDAPRAPNSYLEIGKFKDEAQAGETADKLQQLGYHTMLIHKNLLWMQSYHVQIGPYASQTDLTEAQHSLAAQGFKAHPAN